MKYKQRDIVEVNFLFPDGTFKPHPAIIISNDELQELAKPSVVKCQIIAGYIDRDVNRRLGSIKEKYFNEIVDKVIDSIF